MSAGPRDFIAAPHLDHLGVVFQGRVFETPEEVNEAHAQISDSRYPNAGCKFYAYALTADDLAKLKAVPTLAVQPVATETAPPIAPPVSELPTVETSESPTFTLDGKNIMLHGERIAGLFGEDSQLRVRAEHADLRPAIEAWLQSQSEPA